MMTQPNVTWGNSAIPSVDVVIQNLDDLRSDSYRLHVRVTKDEDGVYSAVILNLPGAGSCGDSETEAISNAKDAARAVIEQYEADGVEIPWKDTTGTERVAGAVDKWVILHV